LQFVSPLQGGVSGYRIAICENLWEVAQQEEKIEDRAKDGGCVQRLPL
jgi:hypothetical protein